MAAARRRFLDLPPVVVSLGLVSFFNDIASEMIYPLLPAFLTATLGAGPEIVGLVEGVAESTAAIGKGFFGWLSDRRRRRKPFVFAGYAASVFTRPLLSLAPGWGAVVGIRFLDRIGKGVRTAPRDAMIAGAVDPARRGIAYGFERAMDNAGAMVGPLVAALLLKLFFRDVRPVFALSVVPGIAALAILLFGTRDEKGPPRAKSVLAGPALPKRFYAVISIFTLFAFANSTDAFLLLRAREAGVPLWAIPALWAFFSGAKSLANTPLGALADRIGRTPTILAGWAVYAGVYWEFGRVHTARGIWAVFGIYALYYALTEGAQRAYVADVAGPEARGRAFGLFHLAVGIAALPASVLFGLLWEKLGPTAAFDAGAAVALLSALALAAVSRPRRTA
ncbi:MAG TPA: MFS transporter [Thermoanaerobaculia bacterium]|nr:MFS transporter [Thermoanaerobaculia bacterium]